MLLFFCSKLSVCEFNVNVSSGSLFVEKFKTSPFFQRSAVMQNPLFQWFPIIYALF